MSAVAMDTLKLVEALEKVDIPRAQARAIVDMVREVREARDSGDVATKVDVRDLRSEMDALRKDMEIMRRDIIIKLGAMQIAGFGMVLAVLFK